MWQKLHGDDDTLEEGAKVDRMVKHIAKSEREAGKSKKDAESIAWATANKRGMLDNKNKKKVKEGDIAPTSGIDTRGAGLGAGRSATTLENKRNNMSTTRREPKKLAGTTRKTTRENYEFYEGAFKDETGKERLKRARERDREEDARDPEATRQRKIGHRAAGWAEKLGTLESYEFEGRDAQGFGDAAPTDTIFSQIRKLLGPISSISEFVVRNIATTLWNRDQNFREQSKRAGLANIDELVKAFIDKFKKNEVHEALEPWMGQDVEEPAFQRKDDWHDSMKQATGGPALRQVKDKDDEDEKPVKERRMNRSRKFSGRLKESMSSRIQAARLEGKAHGLKGHPHCGKNYDDMEECRAYHDGYKEGLDECHGMAPIVGLVRAPRVPARPRTMAQDALDTPLDEMFNSDLDEGFFDEFGHEIAHGVGILHRSVVPGTTNPYDPETQPGLHGGWNDRDADFGQRDQDVDEGNAFTAALARTPKGGTFKLGGRTYRDTSSYNSSLSETDFAFEAWDRQLNSLLNEGFSVSISKGNQHAPDSVNISATDADADKLLSLAKQAGLGVFGDEESAMPHLHAMKNSSPIKTSGEIEVVGDHGDMMGLMKKLSGIEGSASDYEDEGSCEECGHSPCACHDDEMSEARCDECGMMESKCGCNNSRDRMLDEVESEDQMTYQVAEGKCNKCHSYKCKCDNSKKIDEWANKAGPGNSVSDTTFEQDIDFMTKTISGGLNKPKSTGQTTAPIIAGERGRLMSPNTTDINESVSDLMKLAGIKK